MDFFGDGSFWIIQAPGHMPGNLCACARLKNGEWVMLASDCCHSRCVRFRITLDLVPDNTDMPQNRDILDGKKDFGQFLMPDGKMVCLHTDIAAAKDTLSRVRVMEKELDVHIALAHDYEWMKKKTDSVLMSLLDERFIQDIDASLDLEKPF
jgi:glyoxylase-like metal-dependent hydrolase (beta-lactamase superfamily II)